LEKAAKLLETKYPEEALSLYSKAAETVGCEDRPKEASEYMAKVAKLQVCQFYLTRTWKAKVAYLAPDFSLNNSIEMEN